MSHIVRHASSNGARWRESMQVSVEAGEGLERRMRIDLPFEQLSQEVDKRLQKFARSARLPGFRPGKVPVNVLRKRYGEHLFHEVLADMVQSSFSQALDQESLRPAGMPRIEPDFDLEQERVGFTAIFEVMPELELAPIAGQTLKRPVSEVTDGDFDAMIDRLLEQRKTWEPVTRACQEGDQVTISFVGTLEGAAFEGGSSRDVKLELGSGRMIPGFEAGLVGASAGDARTLELAFPEGYRAAHLAGKPVRFEIEVAAVAEPRVPELDAELVKTFGVEDGDIQRFKSDVRSNMERELRDRLKARTKERVSDLLVRLNDVYVPVALIDDEIDAMRKQMQQMLGGAKMELPREFFAEGARRRVLLSLIFSKTIKDHGLKADPEQVRQAIEQMASTYESPQEFIDYQYAERGRLAQFEAMILEDQVVDLVLGQAQLEDEPMSFEQLTQSDPSVAASGL
jgi:trigger factor